MAFIQAQIKMKFSRKKKRLKVDDLNEADDMRIEWNKNEQSAKPQ